MAGFREWLSESVVKGSAAGQAMRKTLEFKLDAEWIKWSVEPRGWITDAGVKDSFDLSVAFYSPKVPKPAFFNLRAHAILDRPDVEYDSVSGGEMKIKASLFLFNGKTGLGGIPGAAARSMKGLLDREGHLLLGQRDDKVNFPSVLAEFDGPPLRTPLQLAEWIKIVIDNTDIGGEDGDDEDPREPVPVSGGSGLVEV